LQPENLPPPPGNPYPVNYPGYAPAPRGGVPVWVWALLGCLGSGCILMVLLPLLAAILFPGIGTARSTARRVSCLSNVKQMGLANIMYAQDYDDRLPIASNWQTDLVPYTKNERLFHCPEVSTGTEQSTPSGTNYAYNSALDMMKTKRLAEPANTVLIYDSTNFSQNANDALTSLPSPGRHRLASSRGNNIGFADGHAKSQPDTGLLPNGQILPDTP
jgi:prepilin-type processing-associated H-X9-DG protein